MKRTITTNTAVAYAQCQRKAFLLLSGAESGPPHEYMRILDQKQGANQAAYLEKVAQTERNVHPYSTNGLESKSAHLTNATLKTEMWEAECSLLTKVGTHSALGRYSYEPTICVDTHSISREQKLALYFVAYVLEQIQKKPPAKGTIVDGAGKAHKINLAESAKTLLPVREPLQEWLAQDAPAEPPVILNEHCPLCQFRSACRAKAEQENNLSLLDRMTPKVMRKLERKGIFTVTQLSYTFRPRKRKKRAKNPPPVTHSLELQALAIREGKIYLQELPEINRQPVELFLDIEGIPDQNLYYLIGLLVCADESSTHHSFWADALTDEASIWQQFVDKANEYPDAPIYHYGNYEAMALKKLANRYGTDATTLLQRLVNVNGFIYGKVYFPIYSNRLKEIGQFIGAKWSAAEASGLQSLVWRHYWEEAPIAENKYPLLVYNEDDCRMLKLLMNELSEIKDKASLISDLDFSNWQKKYSTKSDNPVHHQLEAILEFAYSDYDNKKVSFRETIENKEKKNTKSNLRGPRIKIIRKPTRIIRLPQQTVCPKCEGEFLVETDRTSENIIVDLTFTKNGVKKTTTKYWATKGYCKNNTFARDQVKG